MRSAWLVLVSVLLLLVSCSSSKSENVAPVVDALDMADAAVRDTTDPTLYLVKGKISFHDDDGTVTAIRVYAETAVKEYGLSPPQKSVSNTGLTLKFEHAVAGARIDYEITVIDDARAESTKVKKSVTIP